VLCRYLVPSGVLFSRASSIRLSGPSQFGQCMGGMGSPSGGRSVPRRSGALRNVGLNPRTPRRTRVAFSRSVMAERSLTPLQLLCTLRHGRHFRRYTRYQADVASWAGLSPEGLSQLSPGAPPRTVLQRFVSWSDASPIAICWSCRGEFSCCSKCGQFS